MSHMAVTTGRTGWSTSAGHRAMARAISFPMRPPPMMPTRTGAVDCVISSGREDLQRLVNRGFLVKHGHDRPSDAGRLVVLDDVPAVNNSGCALLEHLLGA